MIQRLREKISNAYSFLFTNHDFKLNNDILNKYCCMMSYICHYAFFERFPDDSNLFTFRFVLDCYHITFYEINGICVTDYYIRMLLENTFTTKFMSYDSNKNKNKKSQKSKDTK